MQPAEYDRRGQPELALRLVLFARKPTLGCLELVENLTADN